MSTTWYAVKTNPRCEEKAEESISRAGFEVYAPKLRKHIIHHRSKRMITRDFSLLTGYVFVGFSDRAHHFGSVRLCDGVKSFLGADGRPEPVPSKVIDEVRSFEASEWLKQDMALRERRSWRGHNRKLGEEVHISRGPLSGFVGRIVNEKDRKSVKIITAAFGKLTEIPVTSNDYLKAA